MDFGIYRQTKNTKSSYIFNVKNNWLGNLPGQPRKSQRFGKLCIPQPAHKVIR